MLVHVDDLETKEARNIVLFHCLFVESRHRMTLQRTLVDMSDPCLFFSCRHSHAHCLNQLLVERRPCEKDYATFEKSTETDAHNTYVFVVRKCH
jgi:hypothetical protein